MKYWFVNQKTSYEEEKNGGFLYAPKYDKRGMTKPYWESVMKVKQGDIIFCNKSPNIVAIAKAVSDGYESIIPEVINGLWGKHGYKVDAEYIELKKPFRFSKFKNEYIENCNKDINPFNKNGDAKQGYLFPIEKSIAKLFIDNIHDNGIKEILVDFDEKIQNEIDELQEENEQFEEISSGIIKCYTKEELEIKDQIKYEYMPKYANGKNKLLREKTDGKLKATRMEFANHNCEINSEHKTFTNSSGKYQYLECHHIIPLKAQKDFPNIKLDSMFNIIALCPICHMQVHHASKEEKHSIFLKMYNIRKNEMIQHGFDLKNIENIFNKYYLNK